MTPVAPGSARPAMRGEASPVVPPAVGSVIITMVVRSMVTSIEAVAEEPRAPFASTRTVWAPAASGSGAVKLQAPEASAMVRPTSMPST